MFARVENGSVVEFPVDDIRQRFPQCSFPAVIKQVDLPEGYFMVEFAPSPVFDNTTHKTGPAVPVLQDGKVVIQYSVEPLTSEEASVIAERAAQVVRDRRNTLLAESDWTQGKDIPDAVSAVWAPYRQALRDISGQAGFPHNVQWPVAP